jgi:quinoprotein glucose dehydrogenase
MRGFSALIPLLALSVAHARSDIDSGIYSLQQAAAGRDVYVRECAVCHGARLEGAEAGPDLAGRGFRDRWRDRTLGDFAGLTKRTMPVSRPAGLPDAQYRAVIAYILNRNGYAPGVAPLEIDRASLAAIRFAAPASTLAAELPATSTAPGPMVEWLHHRGDPGSTNYSALDQINAENVRELEVAWRWKSDNFGPQPWPNLQATPIMANGVLYATAGYRRTVVAIDAATGETMWMYRIDEGSRGDNAPRKGPGRGVAYRRAGGQETVYVISPGYRLIALDAQTGQPREAFGTDGIVDIKASIDQDLDLDTAPVGASSPPIVVGDVVIVGAAMPAGGAPPDKAMPAGHVTAYDAETGERRWIFHTIPQPGEFGHETWEDDSWTFTGNVGVWAPMSADPELGYVYLPVEAPTGDFYGGHRPGDNLFSQSLVCLDARTGERVWHFQTVHHGIWDYDLPAPPVLIDIRVDGNDIPAVAQVTKQGFTFVFDRRTGKPVWPIEERPVAQSTVPGERTSPTQPFPTLPEPFEQQGVTADNLNNLTPEIHAEAKRIASDYTLGPLYTPPTVVTEDNKGTLATSAPIGGANWQGAVADPETGLMYVSSTASPVVLAMVSDPDRSNMRYVIRRERLEGPFGLPLLRPPWGHITAIDLNTGRIRWAAANADTPEEISTHEELQGVELPRTGHEERSGLLVTKTLLFAGEGAGLYAAGYGGTTFRAHDKQSGRIIAEIDLGARQSGVPMTYAIDGRQFIVVAAGAPDRAGELVALALPAE